MEKFNYNSLAFIRRYYHIPASRRLSWALIAETVHGKTEIRLGVVFIDSPYLYIDVAMRRFFTECGGAVSRKAFPAVRTSCRDGFAYRTADGLSKHTPRSYIRDIYFTSVYSRELLRQVLY